MSLQMNRPALLALSVAVLCACGHPATAQQIVGRALAGPPVPFADSGACPFEGCAYRKWTAVRRVVTRRAPSAAAPLSFRIAVGDTVTALTGIVVTTVPGQVRFRDTLTLAAGDASLHITPVDTLFLLTYEGEGFTTAWFKGRLYRGVDAGVAIFNAACESRPSSCLGHITVPVSVTWWVKVRNSAGQIGWTDDPDAFAGKDALGE